MQNCFNASKGWYLFLTVDGGLFKICYDLSFNAPKGWYLFLTFSNQDACRRLVWALLREFGEDGESGNVDLIVENK